MYNKGGRSVLDRNIKVVFITGAADGIGKATAQKFLQEGYIVVGADIKFQDKHPENNVYQFFMDVRNYNIALL